MRGLRVLLLVLVSAEFRKCESSLRQLHNKNEPTKLELPSPELSTDDEDEPMARWAKAVSQSTATVTILYGTTLLLYGSRCSEQLLILTLMRATGFSKIERAVGVARENLKRAVRSAVWHAPSFLQAAHTVRHIHDRMDLLKNNLVETKKAMEDGVITPKEERHLKRLHKRQLALARRDLHRLERASINLRKVLTQLNVVEIVDIFRAFLFQLMAMVFAGHSNSRVGVIITKGCYFVNLGSLIHDVLGKMMRPLVQEEKVDKPLIKTLGKIAVAGVTAYLMNRQTYFAYQLNSALLKAAIIVHGLKYFVSSWWDGDPDTTLATILMSLQSQVGGLLMLILSALSSHFDNLKNQTKMTPPEFISMPLLSIEHGIQGFVEAMCFQQSSDTVRRAPVLAR